LPRRSSIAVWIGSNGGRGCGEFQVFGISEIAVRATPRSLFGLPETRICAKCDVVDHARILPDRCGSGGKLGIALVGIRYCRRAEIAGLRAARIASRYPLLLSDIRDRRIATC